MFLVLLCTHALPLLGVRRLHEQREDGTETKDVYKLGTIVLALGSDEGVIQDLQSATSGYFLFPEKK